MKINDMPKLGRNQGKRNPMYGVHRFGKDSPHYGKKHSERTKTIQSKKRKEWYKIHHHPSKGIKRLDLSTRNIMNRGKKYSEEINKKKGKKEINIITGRVGQRDCHILLSSLS